MTQTPASTDGGQAPTSGLPQAGTSTTDGQAPVSQTAPTEHERIIERLRAEAAANRVELKKYKDEEAARTAAQMTETERLKAELAAQKEQLENVAASNYAMAVREEVDELAGKFNFVLSPKKLTKLLLADEDDNPIEFEDGKPTNIEKLLEKLAKSEPNLVREVQQQRAPAIPAGNPGRSNINPPGQPGKPRRMTEYGRGELFKI